MHKLIGMGHYQIFHEYGDELERRIRLQTFPLAVKLIESEAGIPEGTERPIKNLGYPIALCQACHLSSHAACVYSVVSAIQNGACQVTMPW